MTTMTPQPPTPMKASCHCGLVAITIPNKPDEILECQCTLCRRYGAAWAYFDPSTVTITLKAGTSTREYIWGDGELAFNFCGVCGCMTHWKAIDNLPRMDVPRMGINTRMMEPDSIRTVNRKTSFGALRGALKSKDTAHPEDQAEY